MDSAGWVVIASDGRVEVRAESRRFWVYSEGKFTKAVRRLLLSLDAVIALADTLSRGLYDGVLGNPLVTKAQQMIHKK